MQKLSLLKSMQLKPQDKFVYPFGWKANVKHDKTVQPDALHHLGVSEWLQQHVASFGVINKTHEWKEELAYVQMKEVIKNHAVWETI